MKEPFSFWFLQRILYKNLDAVKMIISFLAGLSISGLSVSDTMALPVPYPTINASVSHQGKYHILQAGGTYVFLDRTKGLSLSLIGHAGKPDLVGTPSSSVLENISLHVSTTSGPASRELDQIYAPDATLRIIAQSPGYTASRVFFSLCGTDGIARGNGTLDIYVLPGRVFLIPSLFIEDEPGGTTIKKAEFYFGVGGKNAHLNINGTAVKPKGHSLFSLYGENSAGFQVLLESAGRPSAVIGWLRNQYPNWMYLNEIDQNPEKDELYEKWPPYIVQRGPLTWNAAPGSGLISNFSETVLKRMSFQWVVKEPVKVPSGRYSALNGIMGIFMDETSAKASESWNNYSHPLKPAVQSGDFRYYNEFEGAYEVNSKGGDVDLTFDSSADTSDRRIFLRIWNLQGKGGYEMKVNGESVPFGLLNDGDLVEDPLVSIDHDVIQAYGPARTAVVEFTAKKGMQTRLTMTRKPGIQLTYEMYSNMERYEAWSDACTDKPLFSIYLKNGNIYNATLPGGKDFAFYMYNIYWPGSPRPARDPYNIRGFTVLENGPQKITFRFDGVDPLGTALSSFTISVPYESDRLTLGVNARFLPLSDGKRWTSFEICNVYPFDTVYRRNFHFKDFMFLTKDGVFDRMGPGAWASRFNMIPDPDHLGYYGDSKSLPRKGPGSHTPGASDGSVWIFGNSDGRGNVLFRRGDFHLSPGADIRLGMCNAWVDLNNNLYRKDLTAEENINYTLEVFGGPLPSVDDLNAMYMKAAGEKKVKQIAKVEFDKGKGIAGFETK
jgi:hypothetical protein